MTLTASKEVKKTLKFASFGGEPEAPFEQSLANLGLSYIKDSSPGLMDYLVGFQLLDQNDDNTHAVGVFGFKVSDDWLYVPIFFDNGKITGHELLFVKSQKIFVPNKENWINFLTKKKPGLLGEKSNKRLAELQAGTPDLRSFIRIPEKSASVRRIDVAPWAQDVLTDFAKAAYAEPQPRSLEDFLASDPMWFAKAAHWYETLPAFAACVNKVYGGADPIVRAGERIKEAMVAAKLPLKRRQPIEEEKKKLKDRSILLPPKKADAVNDDPHRSGFLRTVLYEEGRAFTGEGSEFSDQDRERLRREGVFFIDNRDNGGKSKAYATEELAFKLMSPAQSGVYDVLVHPARFMRALVFVKPIGCYQADTCVVVGIDDEDRGRYAVMRRQDVLVTPDDPSRSWDAKGNWNTVFEGLDSVDSVVKAAESRSKSPDKNPSFVLVGELREGTVPLYVQGWSQDRAGATPINMCSSLTQTLSNTTEGPMGHGYYRPSPNHTPIDYIRTGGREGSRMTEGDDELLIPTGAKAIRLKETIKLGKVPSLLASVKEATYRMKVSRVGSEYLLDCRDEHKRLSKIAALVYLVQDHGLDEIEAREALSKVEKHASVYRFGIVHAEPYAVRFKSAGSPYMTEGPSYAMTIHEPGDSVSTEYGNRPVQEPFYDEQRFTPPHQMDDRDKKQERPDDHLMQFAMEAGQKGQKNVFDVSIIASLVKSTQPDTVISRSMGPIMSGMNALGQVIFSMRWHPDHFQDRYGKADMPELEDSLTNAFESVGDVALYVREKEVRPFGESGEDFGPNVDDVAEQ
jgi:hypothetical protein